MDLVNLENYAWVWVPASDSERDGIQSCDKFNLFRIITVKSTISRWCDKFEDTVSENTESVQVP